MAKYNPRNRNPRTEAPLSWSQKFYESRPENERQPCGFVIPAVRTYLEENPDA